MEGVRDVAGLEVAEELSVEAHGGCMCDGYAWGWGCGEVRLCQAMLSSCMRFLKSVTASEAATVSCSKVPDILLD